MLERVPARDDSTDAFCEGCVIIAGQISSNPYVLWAEPGETLTMWIKLIGAAVGIVGWSALAAAQYPGQFGQPGYGSGGFPGYGIPQGGYGGSGGFMPNI